MSVKMIGSISSIKDEHIILARSLKSRKGRLEHQRILLESEQIIDWALANDLQVEFLLTTAKEADRIAEKYGDSGIALFTASEGILKKVTGTKYLLPLVGVARMPARGIPTRSDFTVVLDDLQDFGNIGTIIRTCQAFGISHVISTVADFDLYQRKTIEASRGSVFTMDLQCFPTAEDTIAHLKSQGYQIVATSPRGSNLQSLLELRPKPVALIVGNESVGVQSQFEEQADFLVQIPMSPAIESLNVGVATGISIYEVKLKQVLAMIKQQIKSTLGRELNVAGMLVQRAMDAELSKVSPLSSRQVIFMMVLKCDEKMTLKAMCRQFGLLESEAEPFLRPLLASGWVQQTDVVSMTPAGVELLAKLWPTMQAAEQKILADFSSQEVETFMRHLRTIQQSCISLIGEH